MDIVNGKPLKGVEAKYVPKGHHNPYEDALNFRSADELVELFYRIPEIPDNLNELSGLERFRLVGLLDSFRVPFYNFQNLAFDIYSMISESYQRYSEEFDWNWKPGNSQEHPQTYSEQSGLNSILLLGVSGIGKSTAVMEIVQDLNQTIMHTEYEGHLFVRYQIVYLKVDCPARATLTGFLRQFLRAIDEATGNTNFFNSGQRLNIDTMVEKVSSLIKEYHISVIIVDEVNFLVNNRKEFKELCNLLTSLMNEVPASFIFIGTFQAQYLLSQNLRTTRRLMKNGCHNWQRLKEDDPEWEFFINQLWKLQFTQKHNELTDEIRHCLYELSQGVLAIAVSIFNRVQRTVILDAFIDEDKKEEDPITIETILEVFKTDFKFLEPIIEAIRTNNIEAVIGYEDILPTVEKLNQRDLKTLEEQERSKRIFRDKVERVRKKHESRLERFYKNFKDMDLWTYLTDEELKKIIENSLKEKNIKGKSEKEIRQIIMKKALNAEEDKEISVKQTLQKKKKELPAWDSPTEELCFNQNQDNQVDYNDYQKSGLIGGLDDF